VLKAALDAMPSLNEGERSILNHDSTLSFTVDFLTFLYHSCRQISTLFFKELFLTE